MFNKNETLATLTKREYIIIEMARSLLSRPVPLDADGDVVDDELLSEERCQSTVGGGPINHFKKLKPPIGSIGLLGACYAI